MTGRDDDVPQISDKELAELGSQVVDFDRLAEELPRLEAALLDQQPYISDATANGAKQDHQNIEEEN